MGEKSEQQARTEWYEKYCEAKENGNWPMKMELDEKLTSGFIEAYIPSLDMAAYLRSINHQFSELEKATIIGNHQCLSKEEKLEALQRMKELTGDENLHNRLEQAITLAQKKRHTGSCLLRGVFHDFFSIPHDFQHGDIVRFVGDNYQYRSRLGVLLKFDEEKFKFYYDAPEDYRNAQVMVYAPLLIKGYDGDGNPIYNYLGGASYEYSNPIYIERIQLEPENEWRRYLEYLPERERRKFVKNVIIKQLQEVWQYYPKFSFMELITTAAENVKVPIILQQKVEKGLTDLSEADDIDMAKIKDFELMNGLFDMLPDSVKRRYLAQEKECAEGAEDLSCEREGD